MTTPLLVRISVWTWLIAALLVGNYHLLQRLPMPAVQGVLFGLTALLLLLYFGVGRVRDWIDRLDLRSLVFLHVTRFVGIYFLILYRRGELPYDFAVPGGWGDIVVAVLALGVVFWPMNDALRRRALTIWNVVGFIDIMLMVVTAARLGLAAPWQMLALTVLPLSLLPTFLVPLIIATHIIIFVRLRRDLPA
jgi:hypothetical protein